MIRARAILVLFMAACGGSAPGQIKTWAGAITVAGNITFDTGVDSGTETLNAKCLLMGASGASVSEDYQLDDTFAQQCSVKGSIQGSTSLTGAAVDPSCHAFLNTQSGEWSIALNVPAALTGTFAQTCPPPLGNSTKTSDFSGEDPGRLEDAGFMASGKTTPGRGSLNGMSSLTPTIGTGSITLTWSVTPE